MDKIKKNPALISLLVGFAALFIGLYLIESHPEAILHVKTSYRLIEAVGLGLVIAVVSLIVTGWVKSIVVNGGPKVELITAEKRCGRLSTSITENSTDLMYASRHSRRLVGHEAASKANTLRVVTLDSESKLDHALDLLKIHHSNTRFGLKVLNPASPKLVDLMVSDGNFVCIGIEMSRENENY